MNINSYTDIPLQRSRLQREIATCQEHLNNPEKYYLGNRQVSSAEREFLVSILKDSMLADINTIKHCKEQLDELGSFQQVLPGIMTRHNPHND